jgi:hypothetical protein
MKLDPGMHIGMHLVSFGKSGVTKELRKSPQKRRENHHDEQRRTIYTAMKGSYKV